MPCNYHVCFKIIFSFLNSFHELYFLAGLGKVILSKAGDEIQKECDSYLKKKKLNYVADGEV